MECSTNARQGQCTRFPVVAAAPFPVLFHRTGIRGVHRDVHRIHPPPGGTNGVRNVDRRRSGRDLAPFPRPPILLRNPLGRPADRPDPGRPGRGNTARTRRRDHARHRRNPHPTAWTESVRRVLVARRLRRRRHENLLRKQLGRPGHRGHSAVLPPPHRIAHPVRPVRQRWPQQTRPRPRPPRPDRRSLPHQDNSPRRRRRLRRRTLRRPRTPHEHHHQSPQQRRVPPPHPGGQRETRPTPTPRPTHRHPHRHRRTRHQEQHLGRHPDQPVRHHHHRANLRDHRPLVRGLAHRPGPRHPGQGQPPQNHHQQKLRHRDRHHRHDRDRRRDRRPLRVPLVHRSLLPRREKHHRSRRNPEPSRKGSPTERPFHIHGPDHHRPVVHDQRHPRNADRRTPQKRPLVHDQNRSVHHGHALRPPRHPHHAPN